jgi:hypothetical protein
MNKVYATLSDVPAWELEAYADGEELPHVATFFAQNPTQQAAWQKEQRGAQQLAHALYRFDCPGPDQLRAYFWKELTNADVQQLQAHLLVCPHCAEELRQLRLFLATEKAPQPAFPAPQATLERLLEPLQAMAEQVRVLFATLVTPLAPAISPVAVRNSPTSPTPADDRPTGLLYETADMEIDLQVQPLANGARRLAGQIFPAPDNATVQITADEPNAPTLRTIVNETGNFVIDGLTPGLHHLLLRLPEQAIVVPDLHLR